MKMYTVYPNLWNTAKAALIGKFAAISTQVKKVERPQINNVSPYLEELEKQEQTKPKLVQGEN